MSGIDVHRFGNKVLRKERFYAHSRERVWTALTDPAAIAEWLMPNDFKPEVGHSFRFQTDPMRFCEEWTECEVLEVEAPHRLAYSWTIHPQPKRGKARPPCEPMLITWVLEEAPGGTRLLFEQRGTERIGLIWRLGMNAGWGHMLRRLVPRVLANVDEQGVFTPGAIPLEKRCYKAKTIPDHLVR